MLAWTRIVNIATVEYTITVRSNLCQHHTRFENGALTDHDPWLAISFQVIITNTIGSVDTLWGDASYSVCMRVQLEMDPAKVSIRVLGDFDKEIIPPATIYHWQWCLLYCSMEQRRWLGSLMCLDWHLKSHLSSTSHISR